MSSAKRRRHPIVPHGRGPERSCPAVVPTKNPKPGPEQMNRESPAWQFWMGFLGAALLTNERKHRWVDYHYWVLHYRSILHARELILGGCIVEDVVPKEKYAQLTNDIPGWFARVNGDLPDFLDVFGKLIRDRGELLPGRHGRPCGEVILKKVTAAHEGALGGRPGFRANKAARAVPRSAAFKVWTLFFSSATRTSVVHWDPNSLWKIAKARKEVIDHCTDGETGDVLGESYVELTTNIRQCFEIVDGVPPDFSEVLGKLPDQFWQLPGCRGLCRETIIRKISSCVWISPSQVGTGSGRAAEPAETATGGCRRVPGVITLAAPGSAGSTQATNQENSSMGRGKTAKKPIEGEKSLAAQAKTSKSCVESSPTSILLELVDQMKLDKHKRFLETNGLYDFVHRVNWMERRFEADGMEFIKNFDVHKMWTHVRGKCVALDVEFVQKCFHLRVGTIAVEGRVGSSFQPASWTAEDCLQKVDRRKNGPLLGTCGDPLVKERLIFLRAALHLTDPERPEVAYAQIKVVEEPNEERDWRTYLHKRLCDSMRKERLIFVQLHVQVMLAQVFHEAVPDNSPISLGREPEQCSRQIKPRVGVNEVSAVAGTHPPARTSESAPVKLVTRLRKRRLPDAEAEDGGKNGKKAAALACIVDAGQRKVQRVGRIGSVSGDARGSAQTTVEVTPGAEENHENNQHDRPAKCVDVPGQSTPTSIVSSVIEVESDSEDTRSGDGNALHDEGGLGIDGDLNDLSADSKEATGGSQKAESNRVGGVPIVGEGGPTEDRGIEIGFDRPSGLLVNDEPVREGQDEVLDEDSNERDVAQVDGSRSGPPDIASQTRAGRHEKDQRSGPMEDVIPEGCTPHGDVPSMTEECGMATGSERQGARTTNDNSVKNEVDERALVKSNEVNGCALEIYSDLPPGHEIVDGREFMTIRAEVIRDRRGSIFWNLDQFVDGVPHRAVNDADYQCVRADHSQKQIDSLQTQLKTILDLLSAECIRGKEAQLEFTRDMAVERGKREKVENEMKEFGAQVKRLEEAQRELTQERDEEIGKREAAEKETEALKLDAEEGKSQLKMSIEVQKETKNNCDELAKKVQELSQEKASLEKDRAAAVEEATIERERNAMLKEELEQLYPIARRAFEDDESSGSDGS